MALSESKSSEGEYIGWVGNGDDQSTSATSHRSSTSARSQKSHRSTSSSTSKSKSKSKVGANKSFQDKLEKLAENSASATTKGSGGSSVATGGGRSQRSSTSHSSKHSSGGSSRRSIASDSKSSNLEALERIAENDKSIATDFSSSVSSSGFTSVSSRSSTLSVASKSSKISKTSLSTAVGSSGSSNSSISSSTSSSNRSSLSSKSNGNFSTRGKQAQGVDYLEAGNYAMAIILFTQTLQELRSRNQSKDQGGGGGGGGGGKKDKHAQQHAALATLYGYRCEALYELGAYDASVRDARDALECERSSRSDGSGASDRPYSSSGRNPSGGGTSLHPERGAVLRAKVSYLLGLSLLRGGNVKGVEDAFEASYDVAEKALEDASDIRESGNKPSVTHKRAVDVLKDTIQGATEGKSTLQEYDVLKTKLDTGSFKKDFIDVLDRALEIAPASMEWQIAKVRHLIGRRRWFVVANHCEQVAAKRVQLEGIFTGDLADLDPFPGIPPVKELDPDFFAENSKDDTPFHLRMLSPKATRDAAFRMPKEIMPYYLRALRLEERYSGAVLVGTALVEFDTKAKAAGNDYFAENERYTREWERLDNTIKMKEEGDLLFRDAYYDRAVALYGECLDIDKGSADFDGSSNSILRQSSSWPVARSHANDAGGKLHAVLHSNRAACFASMGRYEDAVKESSHAIEIHSMYTKAILRRARCHAKLGQDEKAKADFNRYVMLVEGARDHPYPPPNQGSACYFDMPSNVSEEQLDKVKSEMNELGIKPIETRNNRSRMRSPIAGQPKKSWLNKLWCCKNNAASQVVTSPSYRRPEYDRAMPEGGSDQQPPVQAKRKVSFKSSRQARPPGAIPPPQSVSPPDPPSKKVAPTIIKSRPAFDHPIDASSVVVDPTMDYYATLGLTSSASDSEIKQAYHKGAKENHPDRNNTKEAQARFLEMKLAYNVLGDTEKKREYDKANTPKIDP